jgi:hypothetical protein
MRPSLDQIMPAVGRRRRGAGCAEGTRWCPGSDMRIVAGWEPDLLLLDLMIPQMGGETTWPDTGPKSRAGGLHDRVLQSRRA